MPRSTAKITRPALGAVAARPRLFRRLDELLRRHPVVWVNAPAGSGKTTLASSWLAARRRPCLWYQLDASDADPATFFYYLREAVGRLSRRRRETLPLLGPEYALGLAAYARRFFELVGARVPARTTIVLDDFQDLAEDAPLHALLPPALAALPADVRVVVLSRSAPPAPFARSIAAGAVGFLDPEELDLTSAETRALARARVGKKASAADLEAARSRMNGWVAGTVLLLEATARPLPPRRGSDTAAQQVLFDYFAAEIFDRAPQAAQRLLLATALLPDVSVPAAEALTGEPRAAEILAELVRRNYFTVRLGGQEPRYRYHPLFREFLLARGRRTIDARERRALASSAAELAAADHPDEAATILADAGDLDTLERLVLAQAPALARQGRLAPVERWIRALPAARVEADPWLRYWLAVCRMPHLREARGHFQAAYRAFRACGDRTGALLSLAAFLNTHQYVLDEFASLDPWLEEMETLLREGSTFPSIEVEAQVIAGMFAILMWRFSAHPRLTEWDRRARALLDSDAPAEVRLQLALYPIYYRHTWGDYAGARALLDRTRPLLSAPDVRPFTKLFWHSIEANHAARTGEHEACFAIVERALALAERTGVLGFNGLLNVQGLYGALAAGDLGAARRYFATAGELVGPEERLNRGHFLHLGAWMELCAGDVRRAEELAHESLGYEAVLGVDLARSWGEYTLAHVLVERGAHERAVALIEAALAWSRRVACVAVEQDCLLSLAYARLAQGREAEALEWLRRALRYGRERGFVSHSWIGWRKDVMARLAALALEHGVEVEHVHRIIRERRLAPPDDGAAPDAWPWPLRVRTLGGFELWRDGAEVSFPRKPPRKPLELLQALAALGEVREAVLADALWPDADGDAARHSLQTALYRLRRLVGAGAWVVQRGGAVRLDPRLGHGDVQALQRALAAGLALLERRPRADPRAIGRALRHVVELYRGPLLPGCDARWAQDARARLRAAVARFVGAAARHLEHAGEREAANAAVLRALQADPELPLGDGIAATG